MNHIPGTGTRPKHSRALSLHALLWSTITQSRLLGHLHHILDHPPRLPQSLPAVLPIQPGSISFIFYLHTTVINLSMTTFRLG